MNRWNPVRDLITLREAMDQAFNEAQRTTRERGAWQLPLDAFTNEDAIVLVADVPGLNPQEIEITL